MQDIEIINKMKELDEKYKQMRKLAMKVAKEMDSLVSEYASLLKEAKDRNLID